jgi:hypothetical protein
MPYINEAIALKMCELSHKYNTIFYFLKGNTELGCQIRNIAINTQRVLKQGKLNLPALRKVAYLIV